MNLIKIEGWSNPRRVGVRDGKLLLEIKLQACSTCGACQQRQKYMAERLAILGIEGTWERDNELVVIPLPNVAEEDKEAHLEHVFGRPVRFIHF